MRGHSTSETLPDLDLENIYTTYTTQLQLQARSRPSKNLLLDINLLREELGIVLGNIEHQEGMLRYFCESIKDDDISGASSSGDAWVHDMLHERFDVFTELKDRVDELEMQLVQRVDIIQEDHGKAILIFTIVSTIFLPLSFVSSYLGMNTADIRDLELSQALFWQVAAPFTLFVVVVVLASAYNATRILAWLSRGRAGI
ncbi:hypothetical protein BJY04DRAFT_215094 [Aspergillus karnatakaensis]|uniref:uncharacterized protein n=1 Tax=Aspergillus karnatakaensis TaxID=1810916 RepID=UPI003CCDAD3E